MSYLTHFSEEQRQLLIALPYRAGFWVSESDDAGGEEADKIERATLEGIIEGFTADFCKTEVVEELMQNALASKDKWTKWEEDIDKVPEECRAGIELLAAHSDWAVEVRPVSLEEVLSAQEIWLSSSTKELSPVVRVNGQPVNDGKPGPRWSAAQQLFHQHRFSRP